MKYFDAKVFNEEAFTQYVEALPKLRRNMLLKSGAIFSDPKITAALSEQVGGNYITTPIHGRIGGAPLNYDGETDITANTTKTFSQSKVVVGRAAAWVEKDFSHDITGKVKFMDKVGQQVAEYWEDIDEDIIFSVLKGVFSMTGKNKEFVDKHTYKTDKAIDAVTLNTGLQKALGDNKAKFRMAIMHSAVATRLENLNVLEYLKYTDENGMERPTNLATLNGKLVLVDDQMEVDEDGNYVTYALGENSLEITDVGAMVPNEMDRNPEINGGQDTLYSRQRKVYAPIGISFTKKNMATASPTNEELEDGANWELVRDNEGNPIDHKHIPIARLITKAEDIEGVAEVKATK